MLVSVAKKISRIDDDNEKLQFDHTEVGFATYARTGMKKLLPKLAKRLKDFSAKASQLKVPEFKNKKVKDTDAKITHDWLWWRIGGWFKEKDLIVTEAGTLYIESFSSRSLFC